MRVCVRACERERAEKVVSFRAIANCVIVCLFVLRVYVSVCERVCVC